MATHSSILAWRILWTEKPGGLQSTGSQRFRYDSANDTLLGVGKDGGEIELLMVLPFWVKSDFAPGFTGEETEAPKSSSSLKVPPQF